MDSLKALEHKRKELAVRLSATERQAEDLRRRLTELDNWISRAKGQCVDERLHRELASLRQQLAWAKGIGPFKIFNDDTLREIVRQKPLSELALHRVSGIGAERLEVYGRAIVGCILSVVAPGSPLPERPFFARCIICTEKLVLPRVTDNPVRCRKCTKSTDPRFIRPALSVKLPTAKDFDLT